MENPKNPFDTYHIAPISYDEKGRPVADAPFTSTSDNQRYAVIVPPEKVIPVIFVPGIMGSNLKLKKLPDGFEDKSFVKSVSPKLKLFGPPIEVKKGPWGNLAWRPDDKVFMGQKYFSLEAFERRRLLDPANTEIDDSADLDDALELFTFESPADMRMAKQHGAERKQSFVREMKRRGWGTVMVSSYGKVLGFLEKNLNQMYWRGDLNNFWRNVIVQRNRRIPNGRASTRNEAVDWGITKGDKTLTEDDVKKAARYWYPVHAVGYNWLQSNIESGKYLATKIDEFIAHYKKLGYDCEKVILFTHSMGGLAARAAVHPEVGKAADKVIGVIHGVMPTHGAAAAYRRCHAGFEGGSYMPSGLVSKILGEDGPEVAAVFSNSPGALQLLPSKLYGTGWLEVSDNSDRLLKRLPVADPYKEIYEEKQAWWRLMNPEWLDPKPNPAEEDKSKAWARYRKNLRQAERYHSRVGEHSHDHTHIHFGADNEKYRAYGTIRWKPNAPGKLWSKSAPAGNTAPAHEFKSGVVNLQDAWLENGRFHNFANFEIASQNEAGDGTVPRRSGAALTHKSELVAEHTGYDHQGTYKDRRTQELVAYGVARLISENLT